MANYERELRIGADIRRKRKIEKVTEFVERIQKEVGVVLKKAQEEMKRQADKKRKEVGIQKKKSNTKYKRLSVQRVTGKETNGQIYESIYY